MSKVVVIVVTFHVKMIVAVSAFVALECVI